MALTTESGDSLYKARAEWVFWIPLAIQHGVTVNHSSYVKCFVKNEEMEFNRNALRKGPRIQNCMSGHLVRTPSGHRYGWDLYLLGGHNNSRVPTNQCSSLATPWVMPGALLDFHSIVHMWLLQPLGLIPTPTSTSAWCHQWLVLPARSSFCSLLSHKLPSLCIICMWFHWIIEVVSPNKYGIVKRHKHVSDSFSGVLPCWQHRQRLGFYWLF